MTETQSRHPSMDKRERTEGSIRVRKINLGPRILPLGLAFLSLALQAHGLFMNPSVGRGLAPKPHPGITRLDFAPNSNANTFSSASSSATSSSPRWSARNNSGGGSLFRKRRQTARHMVLTTPESIIEQASTQKLLDDLIDESVRTAARKPIMLQFDPSSSFVSNISMGVVGTCQYTNLKGAPRHNTY